jgi:hypothetical protein
VAFGLDTDSVEQREQWDSVVNGHANIITEWHVNSIDFTWSVVKGVILPGAPGSRIAQPRDLAALAGEKCAVVKGESERLVQCAGKPPPLHAATVSGIGILGDPDFAPANGDGEPASG